MHNQLFRVWLFVLMCLLGLGFPFPAQSLADTTITKDTPSVAYDLSEWQQSLTAQQVSQLKHEVKFVILRVQYGTQHFDTVFAHNVTLLQQYRIPYGVYSYSRYVDNNDAMAEAKSLYYLAPLANFYVNDTEENDLTKTSHTTPAMAAMSWAHQLHMLTNKPAVLYSGLSYMNTNLVPAQASYAAVWLADYTEVEPDPSFHYDLWQNTDRHYSAALNLTVDGNQLPSGAKPLSFWVGSASNGYSHYRPHHVVVSTNKKATTIHHGQLKSTSSAVKKVTVVHHHVQSIHTHHHQQCDL